ncbi:MAG: hypothetical protein Q9223_002988 [Gallowayella weberi]
MELAARSLDLVARNIDLVSTLVDATNTPGGLLNLGIQIGEWLQHEKVNRHELKDCFESAYGLAWPNKNGELFRDEVRTKPAVKPLLPLFLQHSGSLGRLLVFDEALCWIVSTTGCLLNYHAEIWVTNVITTIIAESQPKSQSPRKPPLDVGKIQIRSIIKKIVSSVWRVCSSPQDDHLEVLGNVAGQFESFLDKKVPHPGTLPQTDAQTRQELYDPKPLTEKARLPDSSRIWTRCTAQEIIRWMLNLSISSADDFEGYWFYVHMDQKVDSDVSRPVCKIVDILKRMPGILNRQWGNRPPSIVVAEQIEEATPDETERDTFSLVPPANKTQKADAFGVADTSARRDTDTLVGLMTLILLGIVEEKSIDWNSWFCLASSVLLGCSFRDGLFGDRVEDPARPICALQYGNLAAVAGWLDMNKELRVHGSFALNYGEGKLGTINDDHKDNHFRGILSDFAIVQTEGTEDTSSYNLLHPKAPDRSWSEMHDLADHSKAKSDCILVSLGHEVYRLLTRVKSDTHSRIIDPTEAVVKVAAGIPLLPNPRDCTEHAGRGPSSSVPETMTSYSFDEVLGRWPEAGELGDSNYFVSNFLDTELKINVAYALLEDDQRGHTKVISTSEIPCVDCIAKYHVKKGARNDKPMYIINTAPQTPQRKRTIMANPLHS